MTTPTDPPVAREPEDEYCSITCPACGNWAVPKSDDDCYGETDVQRCVCCGALGCIRIVENEDGVLYPEWQEYDFEDGEPDPDYGF